MKSTWKRVLLVVVVLLIAALWWQYRSRPAAPESPQPTRVAPTSRGAGDSKPAQGFPGDGSTGPKPSDPSPEAEPTPVSQATHDGSLLVHVTWSSDSTPAPDIGIRLVRLFPSYDPLDLRWATTDANGTALIEGLAPGPAYLSLDQLSGMPHAQIAAGRISEVKIEIAVGLDLRGVVVDGVGRPIGGAEIWLYRAREIGWGSPVARSADDGSFRIRSEGGGRYVGARAEGFAPSEFLGLSSWPPRDNLAIRLVLDRRGGAIAGRVVDLEDRPIASAIVVIGPEDGEAVWAMPSPETSAPAQIAEETTAYIPAMEDDLPAMKSLPITIPTAGAGEFQARGLAPGPTPLAVYARGFGAWHGSVDVTEGATAVARVRLGRGARLTGIVRDEREEPVAGVLIQTEDTVPFQVKSCLSTADGAYRLEGLTPGVIVVSAGAPNGGFAMTVLTGCDGEELRWDPRLSRWRGITGRVLDEDNTPLQGCEVRAIAAGDDLRDNRSDYSDSAGRFTFQHCREAVHRIVAIPPTDDGRWPPGYTASVDGVRPEPNEVVVRVPRTVRASSVITGLVLDPDGHPPAQCDATAWNPDSGVGFSDEADEGGRFHIDFPPGRFEVRIRAKGFPEARSEIFDLGAYETRDVGTIRLESPGFIVATLRRDARAPIGKVMLVVLKDVRPVGSNPPILGGTARSDPLAAGRYVLRVFGDSVLHADYQVEVRAHEETSVTIVLRPGAEVSLAFPQADDAPQASEARVTLLGEARQVVYEGRAVIDRRGDLAMEVSVPFGRYRVEAVSATGQCAEGSLEIARGVTARSFTFPLR